MTYNVLIHLSSSRAVAICWPQSWATVLIVSTFSLVALSSPATAMSDLGNIEGRSEDRSPLIAQGAPTDITSEMDTYLTAQAEAGEFMGAALVAQGEDTIFADAYGMANLELNVPNTVQTKFRLGSVTKQFTAAAILQLQDQGLLDVNAAIADYLPDYPNGDRITIDHLLSHRAGIPNITTFSDYPEWMRLPTSLNELIARFQDQPLDFEPGEQWSYSNSGYVLLTQIIEEVSEQPYATYLDDNIFAPLEMNQSGYDDPLIILENRASGYQRSENGPLNAETIHMSVPQGAGGLYSTVEDLARWTRGLFTGSVLDEASLALMIEPLVQIAPEENPNMFYGYGIIMSTDGDRPVIGHAGGINGFSSNLVYYPEEDLTIVVLSNLEAVQVGQIAQQLGAIALSR